MSKKHHGGPAPVPPGNRPHTGPGPAHDAPPDTNDPHAAGPGEGAGFEEQDPKDRLGGFTGKGEHSIQQPSTLNDGDHHSK